MAMPKAASSHFRANVDILNPYFLQTWGEPNCRNFRYVYQPPNPFPPEGLFYRRRIGHAGICNQGSERGGNVEVAGADGHD